MNRRLWAIALILFSFNIANAQDLYFDNSVSPFTPFQQIRTSSHVRGYPIPSIGSPFELVSLNIWNANEIIVGTGGPFYIPMTDTYLVASREGQFILSLDMQTNLIEHPNIQNWADEPCKREDVIWKRSIGGRFSNVNCAMIDVITDNPLFSMGKGSNQSPDLREKFQSLPETAIRVKFTRYGQRGKRLSYEFRISPEIAGIEAASAAARAAGSWQYKRLYEDPKKAEFISNLTMWATEMQNRIDLAFEKSGTAFSGVSDLNTYFSLQKPKGALTPPSASSAADLEAQLKSLRELFEKKLITERQFNDQVKELLNRI